LLALYRRATSSDRWEGWKRCYIQHQIYWIILGGGGENLGFKWTKLNGRGGAN